MDQNIKTEVQSSQNTVQPIDRTNEVLIDPETSFDDLLRILQTKPDIGEADKLEREERERAAKEARLRAAFGKDYEAVVEGTDEEQRLQKAKRRPGAIQLRTEVPRIAAKQIRDDGLCEVFVNGYAIYDNGDRKTVLWVPDCRSVTYNFTKLRDNEKQYQVEKDTVGQDVFGPAPWYIALMVAGENSIERNLDHPRSIGTMSDSDAQDDFEVKAANRWIGGTHFDNPEDAYIKKEEAEEIRRNVSDLKKKHKDAVGLYYFDGLSQEAAAERLGISQSSFCERLNNARGELTIKLKNFL
jgi:RNA polymerase sigma factor (sigma-70 family)